MKSIKILAISLLACFGSVAYAAPQTLSIERVVRVFMHQPGDYSIMKETDTGYLIARLDYFLKGKGKTSVREVEFKKIDSGSPMRVEFTLLEKNFVDPDYYKATIYIWGPEAIDGGEWRSGKKGTIENQTMVVR